MPAWRDLGKGTFRVFLVILQVHHKFTLLAVSSIIVKINEISLLPDLSY